MVMVMTLFDLGLTHLLLLVTAFIVAIWRLSKRNRNLPPGPSGWPVFGNLFQLLDRSYLKHFQWAERYGKVHSVKLPGKTIVMVNDMKLAKELLSGPNFAARPEAPLFEIFSGGKYGIVFNNGHVWEEQRRWSLRKLRDFGFGKSSMEGIILDEVKEVLDYFREKKGVAIKIEDRFNIATLNALWTLLTGNRLTQDDPKLANLQKAFHDIPTVVTKSGLVLAPWLRHVRRGAYQKVKDAANYVMSFAREAVAEHFESHVEGSSRDFMDEYISEIKNTTDPTSSFYKETGRKNLEGLTSDFLQAGSETSSTTITWAICYLSHFPKIQLKMQQELDSVLGSPSPGSSSRTVSLADKPSLPYSEAVVLETLRHSSIVSGGVQHVALYDTEVKVDGKRYLLPKGTWLMTNMYYIHHNPQIWEEPMSFMPERFLSIDGTEIVRNENVIPFQLGRRQCLGESLARDTLFLFLTLIFHQFHIKKLEPEPPQPQNSYFLVPETYNFVFEPRN